MQSYSKGSINMLIQNVHTGWCIRIHTQGSANVYVKNELSDFHKNKSQTYFGTFVSRQVQNKMKAYQQQAFQ